MQQQQAGRLAQLMLLLLHPCLGQASSMYDQWVAHVDKLSAFFCFLDFFVLSVVYGTLECET
jgi:hypothetical protein